MGPPKEVTPQPARHQHDLERRPRSGDGGLGRCPVLRDQPQVPAGWNSSIGLPDGSSNTICEPPGPVTMSLRNRTPACHRRSTSAAMSLMIRWIRFQSPGPGRRPSGIGRPAELAGPLSSSRRPPPTSAKAGADLERTVKPRFEV